LKVKREEFSICSKGVVSKGKGVIQCKKDLLCKSTIRRNLEKVRSPSQWAPVEDMPKGVGCLQA